MTDDPRNVADAYFRAWLAKDFDQLRSLLADDVTFRGPLGTADDAETYMQGMRGMGQVVTGISVVKVFADGPDVLTWFDLHTSVAPPFPTVNWMHIENGRITSSSVIFDARHITAEAPR